MTRKQWCLRYMALVMLSVLLCFAPLFVTQLGFAKDLVAPIFLLLAMTIAVCAFFLPEPTSQVGQERR